MQVYEYGSPTSILRPYLEILEELRGLAVRWVVADNGHGAIRSMDDRCPLHELWFQRTGHDWMPSGAQVGLTAGQKMTFTFAADGSQLSNVLRGEILPATVG